MYSRISGTGSYLPEKILTNHDLEKMVDTSDEWIVERTGIKKRHIAEEGETTCDLAEIAARRVQFRRSGDHRVRSDGEVVVGVWRRVVPVPGAVIVEDVPIDDLAVDHQVVAEVKLFIRIADEWMCKGSQTGQMQIVRGNVGDAMKGAITDALQKCFSLLSIGSDAYRGLLKEVYFSGAHQEDATPAQASRQPDRTPSQPPADQPVNNGLPKIDGIKYQRRNGIIVAVGNSFDKKELLKSAGFRWDGAGKHWYKETATLQ